MSSEHIETVIGEDIIFKGNLRFSKNLQINGQFKGTIESDGKLLIGEKGFVDGDINVHSLVIMGKMKGNADANQSIKILHKGYLAGDIRCPDLEIGSGARFNGNCVMNE